MAAAKAVAITLLIGGLFFWGVYALPPLPTTALDVEPEQQTASALPAVEDGRITIEGVIIHTDVVPRVPYIEYEYQEGEVRTKQLIIRNERGCSPGAGDLPCIANPNAPNPEVPYGERVRVTGTVVGDQIMVDSIERI